MRILYHFGLFVLFGQDGVCDSGFRGETNHDGQAGEETADCSTGPRTGKWHIGQSRYLWYRFIELLFYIAWCDDLMTDDALDCCTGC
ncbi:hypothetical protein B0I37DRAFT_378281 [Chaetomium sp. MPI-CAGE-AT-0009]|nr:hypothetical protein B0I37DRAFT_378281 [Chaetomium sp. MPI-CAGE-AT-0009]